MRRVKAVALSLACVATLMAASATFGTNLVYAKSCCAMKGCCKKRMTCCKKKNHACCKDKAKGECCCGKSCPMPKR